jgi:hypothetical protein
MVLLFKVPSIQNLWTNVVFQMIDSTVEDVVFCENRWLRKRSKVLEI